MVTGGDEYKVAIGLFGLFGAAGIMALTEGDVLPDQQRNWVGSGVWGSDGVRSLGSLLKSKPTAIPLFTRAANSEN